jgi:iron complex outermembrane receptor protein
VLFPHFCALAQIPSAEDMQTKSRREVYQEGLEVREVRESSARDVGEALSKIEGVWKLRKGGIANDVVLRGFQGGNLNVLIDGARIYGACPGHMDPAAFHVDFAEVERIEITKGPFDLASQGSLGGSVNVIRKQPAAGLHLAPSLQLGSFGYVNPALTGSVGSARLEASFGYSFRRSLPFLDGHGNRMTEGAGYRPQFLNSEAFRVHTGWTGLRFSPRPNQSGELAYTRQDAANVLYPYLQMDAPYDIADRLSAGYRWADLAGALKSLRASGFYTAVRHWMTDEKRTSSVAALDVFSMATFARTRAVGARLDMEFENGILAGAESYQRNWDAVNSFRSRMMVADQNIVPNVNSTIAGFYADYSRNLTRRLRLGAGGRLDTANMYVRSASVNESLYLAYKGVSGLSRRDTNASWNLRASYGRSEAVELFLGAGSTVRVPDAQERYYNHQRPGTDWVGNPAIRPSRNTETNLGLNFRAHGFYLRPLVFYSAVTDYIAVHNQARLTAQPGITGVMARSYENVDARIYGGEVAFGASVHSRWLLSGGLSVSQGSKDPLPERGIFDTDLAEMPPVRGRTSLRYGTRLWFAELEGLAAGPQRCVDSDLRELATSGYFMMNVRAGIHRGPLALTFGVENVLDRFYLEFLSYQRDPFRTGFRVPEPGRNIFLNFGFTF